MCSQAPPGRRVLLSRSLYPSSLARLACLQRAQRRAPLTSARVLPLELLTLPPGTTGAAWLDRAGAAPPRTAQDPSAGPLGLAGLSLRELGAASWLTAALVLPDKPPTLLSRGAHLPPPQLWLPPHALLGFPVPQALLRRAHLPLETERGQAGLRGPGRQPPQTTVRPQSTHFPARGVDCQDSTHSGSLPSLPPAVRGLCTSWL